jgi:hypothetical protein
LVLEERFTKKGSLVSGEGLSQRAHKKPKARGATVVTALSSLPNLAQKRKVGLKPPQAQGQGQTGPGIL